MNDKFGEIAAELAAIPSSEIRRDEIHQALNAAYRAGRSDEFNSVSHKDIDAREDLALDEPDVSDLEFAERAEQDKQDFFDRSRGVGQ